MNSFQIIQKFGYLRHCLWEGSFLEQLSLPSYRSSPLLEVVGVGWGQIFLFLPSSHNPFPVSSPEFRHLAPCFCPPSPITLLHETSIRSPGPLFPGQFGTHHPVSCVSDQMFSLASIQEFSSFLFSNQALCFGTVMEFLLLDLPVSLGI